MCVHTVEKDALDFLEGPHAILRHALAPGDYIWPPDGYYAAT
jgi:hypothetical protein